jgi:uncharacterized protein YgiM (DUF1202 family)
LSNGDWVREDLVSESAGCDTLGAEMEEEMVETGSTDECVVTAINGAVLRSGAGIAFETAGALGAGESRTVIRSQVDLGGQTWWRLSGGAWVREDLVNESPGCDTLGEEDGGSETSAAADECVVTAIDGAVLRRGPDTSFETAGALGAGESRAVIRSQDDLGGQTWWRLSNGAWVREDLVNESPGCDTLG